MPLAPSGPEAYFKGNNYIERVLRFLNLLEPGHMVLSLSKVAMWGTGGLVIYCVLFLPNQLTDLIGSLVGFSGAIGGYGYRRYSMYANGQSPYPSLSSATPDGPLADAALTATLKGGSPDGPH